MPLARGAICGGAVLHGSGFGTGLDSGFLAGALRHAGKVSRAPVRGERHLHRRLGFPVNAAFRIDADEPRPADFSPGRSVSKLPVARTAVVFQTGRRGLDTLSVATPCGFAQAFRGAPRLLETGLQVRVHRHGLGHVSRRFLETLHQQDALFA